MSSSGSGWSYVMFETTIPMTIKEFAKFLDDEYNYGSSNGPNGLAIDVLLEEGIDIVKIC